MRHAVLVLCLLCLPLAARAAPIAVDYPSTATGIAAALLTSNPSMTLRPNGVGALTVYVQLFRGSTTAVNMSCTAGPSATLLAPLSVANVNGTTGAIGLSPAAWSYPVSSSGVLRMVISPVNDNYLVCSFSGTGAGAGDSITVSARYGSN